VRLDIQVFGEDIIAREILRPMGDRALDARPAFEKIGDQFMEAEEELFDSQGNAAGQGWEPIQAATIEYKRRAGLDPRILHATLDLRKSLTERGDENQVLITEDSFMVFGSTLKQFEIHQRQGERKPLAFGEQTKRDAVKTLQRFIFTGEVE